MSGQSKRCRILSGLRRGWPLLLLPIMLGIWAFLIEPRWVAEREIHETVAGWRGPSGLKVAVASDWHLGQHSFKSVMTVARAQAIVERINAARPDLILLPGDFISGHGEDGPSVDEIAQVLGRLHAPLGVYAVLGNHDWWGDGPGLAEAFSRAGITVLENSAKALPSTDLWLVGIGDDYTGHADPGRALRDLPGSAQALVMMHDPASLAELPSISGRIFAGHTHGGQVWLPFIGALVVPGRAPRRWAYGWVEHQGNRLYVTSGLGTSILPLRFNQRPEWVMFTLNAQ